MNHLPKIIAAILLLTMVNIRQVYAQEIKASVKEAVDMVHNQKTNPMDTDSVHHWIYGGNVNLNISQVALVQWAGGGNNAVAINGNATLFTRYHNKKFIWEARLDLAFGTQKQGSLPFRKSDDKILFNTTAGYVFHKGWQFAGLLNFRSQFAKGYSYPNDSTQTLLSQFMAPGYLIGAIGFEYTAPKYFSIFVSPISSKSTFVLSDNIDPTLYGVDSGKHVFEAVGAYIAATFQADIWKNINFYTKVELFSDYLKNPQNVSVIWNTKLTMKVNDFLDVSFITDLVYDDNVLVPKTHADGTAYLGKGIQFRENLAVGLGYKFGTGVVHPKKKKKA